GSTLQRGIQSVTAALQGLAGGNIAGALAGASAPELANIIGHHMGIDDDPATKAIAHAILGGAVAALQGNNAMAGAAGAAVGEVIASQLYPNVPKDKLTEDQKQTISTLASISAGIAGGLAGDSTLSAAAGSQAGKNAVENNYLSVSEKTELEIAKQTLKNSKDAAEREKAQQKYDALVEKDITSDKEVIDACSNGNAGSTACANARLNVLVAKGSYETGPYNSKFSQQYADAYGQIAQLLGITSVDAQHQQQVKDAMINYFMVTKGVNRQTAEDYAGTKQGVDIIVSSIAPIMGLAVANKVSSLGLGAVKA
uniref:VENN motif pre-toxin domain-containing protein n=1 Tax=Lelliottia amnigena TaxID=61646 RepID=UPI004055FB13